MTWNRAGGHRLASRNRIVLSNKFFSRLINHASVADVSIEAADSGRWIKKLSDDDQALMTSADCKDVLKLTRTLRAVHLTLADKRWLVCWGFSELQSIPEGLLPTNITPALLCLSVEEADITPAASALKIKEAIEAFHKDQDGYEGHDLEDVLPLFGDCQAFCIEPDFEYTSTFPRLIGLVYISSYFDGPMELSDKTLEDIAGLFETGSKYLPYELLLQGVLSISWRGFFLELYRCIEQLFPAAVLPGFVDDLGEKRPLIELAKILETRLSWRPRENEALIELLKVLDEAELDVFRKALAIQIDEDVEPRVAVGRRVYALRNGFVHFRPALEDNAIAKIDIDLLLQAMMSFVMKAYDRHASRFHGPLLDEVAS